MRSNVTFRTSLPFDTKVHTVGYEVAEYLSSALANRAGLDCSIEDWRDSGWELDFSINGKALHFAFVYMEDSPFQFYGQVSSYVGVIRRLFGYRDHEEIDTAIKAIHETLKNDPNFKDVFWHEAFYEESKRLSHP